MQGEVVDAGGQVDVVGIRLPLHRKAEHVDVKTLHRVEIPRVQYLQLLDHALNLPRRFVD